MINVCSSTRQAVNIESLFNFEFSDECSICLEPINAKADGDTRDYRELARTECKHFFHQFCLEKYLNHEKHLPDSCCPTCRGALAEYHIINLDPQVEQGELERPVSSTRVLAIAGFIASISISSISSYAFGFYNGQSVASQELVNENLKLLSQLQSQLQNYDYNLAKEFLIPAALVGATGLATRLTAGGLGIMAKGSSIFAEYFSDELSQKLNSVGDYLNTFAMREIKTELQIAAGLTTLRIGAFVFPALFNGS